MEARMLKRAFDIVLAASLLLLTAPLLLVAGISVRLLLGSPVLFRQQRPGLGGKPFLICKFRTMTDRKDATGRLLPDDQRLTRFGRLLRSTSIDELPELWNVLRGEMSFVGPRPLMMAYLPLYDERQAVRHNVRPGITGWAQVQGRNAISWEQKFDADIWYVEHRGFWLDLRILLRTAAIVVRREGISAQGEATMMPFMGNPKR